MYSDPKRIAAFVRILKADRVPYRLLDIGAAQEIQTWVDATFPIARWGGVDWDRIEHSVRRQLEDYDDLAPIVRSYSTEYGISDGPVTLLWGDGSKPFIEVPLGWVAENTLNIAEEERTWWAVRIGEPWCIEASYGGKTSLALPWPVPITTAHNASGSS